MSGYSQEELRRLMWVGDPAYPARKDRLLGLRDDPDNDRLDSDDEPNPEPDKE